MWTIKLFKTREQMEKWIARNGHLYQIVEVFVNNGYALDVRRLRQIG